MLSFICIILCLKLIEPVLCQSDITGEDDNLETDVSQTIGTEILNITEIQNMDNVSDITNMRTEWLTEGSREESTEVIPVATQQTTLPKPEEPETGLTSTPEQTSSLKPIVIVIILVLSLLLMSALFLIYWFCIRKKAPRDDVSTEMEESPKNPEDIPETKSLSSEEIDLSIRSVENNNSNI